MPTTVVAWFRRRGAPFAILLSKIDSYSLLLTIFLLTSPPFFSKQECNINIGTKYDCDDSQFSPRSPENYASLLRTVFFYLN